ncbi:hypothetical protein FE392_12175 [Xenorhabdus sp. 12]|uniref:Uncharacterized protein n=1 Tax=Xenorhabdus santafensis TaxID=2582833 RepID=A0ABU4SBA4_9GAMM|nr:hypothetical protein [Xenorhabdus sp. 12]
MCHESALKLFPVKNEVASRTVFNTMRQRCANSDLCGKERYFDQTFPTNESYAMDVNQDSRGRHMRNCMNREGWGEKIKYWF